MALLRSQDSHIAEDARASAATMRTITVGLLKPVPCTTTHILGAQQPEVNHFCCCHSRARAQNCATEATGASTTVVGARPVRTVTWGCQSAFTSTTLPPTSLSQQEPEAQVNGCWICHQTEVGAEGRGKKRASFFCFVISSQNLLLAELKLKLTKEDGKHGLLDSSLSKTKLVLRMPGVKKEDKLQDHLKYVV